MTDGREVTAHVANPGSMLGMKEAGLRVWLEPNNDPKRKLRYSWKLVEKKDGTLIGVDTSLPNRIVGEALRDGFAAKLGYSQVCPEVKYGENSRVDFLLTDKTKPDCYLEIKSVTLSRINGLGEFPDSVTKRGAKHMEELAHMVAQGRRAILLYLVQRNDINRFAIAGDIDPDYMNAAIKAKAAGVEVECYGTSITTGGISLADRIM